MKRRGPLPAPRWRTRLAKSLQHLLLCGAFQRQQQLSAAAKAWRTSHSPTHPPQVIFNTVSSMALPLCLDRLVSSVVALIVSSTAIVVMGEIVPQVRRLA